jgi:hypothetical protein
MPQLLLSHLQGRAAAVPTVPVQRCDFLIVS